jgi:SAM-dependent methyltransferase
MIFSSIDINENNLDEVLNSLPEIKQSKFDGVELCLWQNMNTHADKIKSAIDSNKLKSNIHCDLMRAREGIECCRTKLTYSLKFGCDIGAQHIIAHPIKPYAENLELSRNLFSENSNAFLVEIVKGTKLEDIHSLGRPFVLDIGNLIKNGEYSNSNAFNENSWVHAHDFAHGKDHLSIGRGSLDWNNLMKRIDCKGITIELGSEFRKWSELKQEYRHSIDVLNNARIFNESYGRNIRLMHLKSLISEKRFAKAVDFGCGDGYILHNITADEKVGFDNEICPVFNDIVFYGKDISSPMPKDCADIAVCCEAIEHIPNYVGVIKNIYNSLSQDGFIFLSTINKNVKEDKSKKDAERGHLRRYGPELKEIIEKEGFRTLEFYPFRSSHYYEIKNCPSKYNISKDIELGENSASGWIYFGCKES